jgi:hypothetical protein
MAKRQTRTSRSVWEDQTTEYNPEAPAVIKALRGEKWKRRALYITAFGVVPLCLLLAAAQVSGAGQAKGEIDLAGASVVTNSSAGKSAAFAALQNWLSGDPSPLPQGLIVSWNGYTVEDPPPADPNKTTKPPTYRFETHSFTLARGDQMFTADVQVVVDGSASAMATSTPTLTPILNAELTQRVESWFGFDTTTPPEEVNDAVAAWADAFTSGDPDELRRAVQDKDADHTYLPLSNVASVVSTTAISAADVPTGDEGKKPTQMLVRVELRLWWAGEEPAEDDQSKKPAPITYDLLIEDADTAAPYVVAWGPVGSAPTLKAHANAMRGVDVKQQADTGESTPGPTPSASPSEGAE